MAKKKKHTFLKVVGTTAAAGTAAYASASYIVFRNAFEAASSKYLTHYTESEFNDEEKTAWYAHSDKEDEFIDSFDGLKIHGLRITNHPDSHKWAILLHGASSQSGNMQDAMWQFDHRGFNILAVDQRGYGMSEGKYSTLGWLEHYDLITWINHLVLEDEEAEIVLYGVNLGGAAVINAAGDYLPPQVKCAVEDGSWSGIREFILHVIRRDYNVEGGIIIPGVDIIAKNILHFSITDVDMRRQLKQASVPILFAHGELDETVPASMVFDCYYACASEKDLYIDHEAGFNEQLRSNDYWNAVFGFVTKYISED